MELRFSPSVQTIANRSLSNVHYVMRGASRRPQDFRVSTLITALIIHRLSDRGNKWVGLVSSVGRFDDGTKAGKKGTKRRGFAKGRRAEQRVDAGG